MGRLQFSNTTDRTGIIELLERNSKTQSATSSSYPLKVKTVDVNSALGNFALIAIKSAGRQQWDDTNQSDFPILTTDLTSGQQDYTLLLDGASIPNQILDLYTVRVKDASGNFHQITPIDRQDFDISRYDNQTGTPTQFDLTSDGIVLYPTPNYTSSGGIEVYVTRNPVYFLSTDTTKVAGIPEPFQDYLHLKPAYMYCMINTLPQAAGLKTEVEKMEKMIADFYSRRVRVEKPRMKARVEDTK